MDGEVGAMKKLIIVTILLLFSSNAWSAFGYGKFTIGMNSSEVSGLIDDLYCELIIKTPPIVEAVCYEFPFVGIKTTAIFVVIDEKLSKHIIFIPPELKQKVPTLIQEKYGYDGSMAADLFGAGISEEYRDLQTKHSGVMIKNHESSYDYTASLIYTINDFDQIYKKARVKAEKNIKDDL
jgi:hypothetical protein